MTTQANTKRTSFGATAWQMTLMGLRYLSGRKLRTTLTTLAIVFGVALIFAINLTLPGVGDAFKQTLTTISGADITITSVTGNSFVPEDVLPRVTSIAHVQSATGVLERTFTLPTLGGNALGKTAQIDLIGVDPTSAQSVRQFTMSAGRFLQVGDTNKAVFPAGIAELAPQLKVGATFPLITAGGLKIFTVVGLLAEQGSLSSPQMYVSLADAQAMFNQPGLINTIQVSLDASADKAAVQADILKTLGSDFQVATTSNAADIAVPLQAGLAVLDLLGVLALFLGAFLIFNTFRTVVIERQHDLAMLRAIGATRGQITTMIVIESLLQGIAGTVIGLILGYLMAAGLVSALAGVYASYFAGIKLGLSLTPSALGLAVILGVLTALIAGYLPARSAGRTSPLEALRPATAVSVQRTARWSLIIGVVLMVLALVMLFSGSSGAVGGALFFLIGMVIAAPGLVIPVARLFSPLLSLWFAREGDLARGNLARQPGRAAITGSTLMIGLAVLIAVTAIVSGFAGLVTNLTNASFSGDIVLIPQSIGVYNNIVGADSSLSTRLSALPETQTVASLRYADSKTEGQSLEVLGIDPNTYPKVATLDFNQGQADQAFVALGTGRNAILTPLGAAALKVSVGSDFALTTAHGTQTYHVVGVASDVLSFKINGVFISQANLATDFDKTEDVLIFMNLKPGSDKAAALADVQKITQDYPQFTAHLSGEYKDELIQTTNSAFYLFYALAILILIPAALGLLNTLTINILERTREIGVVRAVGGSRGQVRRIVTAEALLLGVFSAAMGVFAGVVMSYGFISAFSSIGWSMSFTFPLIGIIAALIVGVLLALFASILPARSAARLDIIRALQYE
ncbi:MAG TPA: FtsX-like permease family protein [Phototrophicaceae bacterium]|nr:FtsX-like permease family protein [Phototrophicaceae bacterium]